MGQDTMKAELCPVTEKVRHKSRGKAQAALRSMRKRPSGLRDNDILMVYECKYCGDWHTGRNQFLKALRTEIPREVIGRGKRRPGGERY